MMLQCLNSSGCVSNGAELTVLERQRDCMKRHQHQQGLHYSKAYSVLEDGVGHPFQAQACVELSGLGQVDFPMVKPETRFDGSWTGYGHYGMPSADDFVSSGYADDSGTEYSYQMKKTASYPASAIGENSEGYDSILTGRMRSTMRSEQENSKKRKADMPTSLKVVDENDTKEKKIKNCAEDGESKITQTKRSTNNKNKIKGEASADSSKVSEVQKTDYIHVRARRGQATDSHSLAERVRREKISERMKYLQELVPGCHRITGKAGMLDEIINYVQSLQRQVEFLSRKLATVNPQLNFNIESLFEKEVKHITQACTSSYPTLGSAQEMNSVYNQSSHLEEVISTGIDLQTYQPDMGLQMQLTETFADTNAFSQVHQNYPTWDAELQNLFSMEFHARSATYPFQTLTGSNEANNLKMEI